MHECWRAGIRLADFLAAAVSQTRRASACICSRAELHPQRPANAGGQDQVGETSSARADVGIRDGQVLDRSDLVVPSFLDTRLLAAQPRPETDADQLADLSDLFVV